MADFSRALANDIKPALGVEYEVLERYTSQGIITWNNSIQQILDVGGLFVHQAANSEVTRVQSIILEGSAGCGKTALATQIAKNSNFPFLKICSPENMIGFDDREKVNAIKKIFEDAYKSKQSLIILDDIEGLLDYVETKSRFSDWVLQHLRVCLRKPPPRGHKLLVIGTTSCKTGLQDLHLLKIFQKVLHVPNISTGNELLSCIDKLNIFSPVELKAIKKVTLDKKFSIGIKHLLQAADFCKHISENDRVSNFLLFLKENGDLEL